MTTRQDSLTQAIVRLSDALTSPETDLSRDAAIQRFEFCFELAWKVIQERARTAGSVKKPDGWPCSKTVIAPLTRTTKRSPKPSIADSPVTSHCSNRWRPRYAALSSNPHDS